MKAFLLDTLSAARHLEYLMKSVSPDIHSTSIGAQTRIQGDKTENKDKGKSPVVTISGFRDLNAKFEEYNNNSSNGVNAASFLVSTAGQNSIDSTNDFSAAGPSNAAMLNLEDLSHNADDVGAEADINNLESIISVKKKKDGIFINQDKYVAEILRKFGLSEGKLASTPIDVEKPLLKDSDGKDVDVHTYRLISWQCKKQTVVATSLTESEYVAASGCAQVLWIQNQLLDYG
nr:putative ribonuclease H-like domain-containing protein [Tanacetum cinerariifolium]